MGLAVGTIGSAHRYPARSVSLNLVPTTSSTVVYCSLSNQQREQQLHHHQSSSQSTYSKQYTVCWLEKQLIITFCELAWRHLAVQLHITHLIYITNNHYWPGNASEFLSHRIHSTDIPIKFYAANLKKILHCAAEDISDRTGEFLHHQLRTREEAWWGYFTKDDICLPIKS